MIIDGKRASDRAIELILAYYAAFNRGDWDAMLALLDDEVAHDLNQGRRETGIASFRSFLARMHRSYGEQLRDIVVTATPDGTHAAAEYVVHGEYRADDEGLPPARGQRYVLPGGAFFTLSGNRITRVTNYYNLQDWLQQVDTALMAIARCPWAESSEIEADYHDREWGVPVHDDRVLFEFLTLEGAQAGLSWRTVLQKREGYRAAFLDYDLAKLVALTDAQLEQRLADPGIVRNRLKVWSVRSNARAALDAIAEHGSLDALLWSFVDGRPLRPQRRPGEIPARTEISDRMSKALSKRGFKFVGSTILYAFMQATGMVNDHLVACPRHAVCAALD